MASSYASENVANGCYRLNEAKDNFIVSEISEANPLKPAEAFFVKATAEGASITFNPQRKDAEVATGSIRLEIVENGKILDRLIVKPGSQGLEKLSLNENSTKLFAVNGQREMAVVPCEGNEHPVNFKANHNGTYTLRVDIVNLKLDYLHLIDDLTGTDIDLLQQPSYTFSASGQAGERHFKLLYKQSEK